MKTFRRRRESELKNGRVAMFASMGCGLVWNGGSYHRPKLTWLDGKSPFSIGKTSLFMVDFPACHLRIQGG